MRISDKIIKWFEQRKGEVTYSMTQRTGDKSYDCSSSVYYAISEALGLEVGYPISTETEHDFLLKNGFEKIADNTEWEAKRGDIFILGRKGYSAGAGGHTGVFVDKDHIIHCNYDSNGISIDRDTILPYNKMGWYAYRLKDDKEEKEFEVTEKIQERYMITGNYSIDSLPWGFSDKKNIGSTEKYIGFVVTITRKWGNYWYSQFLGGFVDSRAFEPIETISEKMKVVSDGYSVDTLPWGTKGFKTVSSSTELKGREFQITAKSGDYLYIHELAKWVDKKAFK